MSEPITAAKEQEQKESGSQHKVPPKQYEYRTTILFKDKVNLQIVSVQPPQLGQARILTFLLRDRLTTYNLDDIRSWTTEQLGEIVPSRIIVGENEG